MRDVMTLVSNMLRAKENLPVEQLLFEELRHYRAPWEIKCVDALTYVARVYSPKERKWHEDTLPNLGLAIAHILTYFA